MLPEITPRGRGGSSLKSTNSRAAVRAATACVAALLLVGLGICHSASAQVRGAAGGQPQLPRRLNKPLSRYELSNLPNQRITKEQAVAWKAQNAAALKAGPRNGGLVGTFASPPPTTTQFVDLTTVPRPPQLGESTRCQEIHPMWAWDQQRIYFASNNVDPVANYGQTTPGPNAPFHLYWMSSDGVFITQLTGLTSPESTATQLFPAVNHALTKLAYVNRARAGDPFQLFTLDLNTGTRTQLTGITSLGGLNAQIVSVEHPSWSPGDSVIAFSARNLSITGDVRNIYLVNSNSKVVTQLTFGPAANGVDSKDPVFHPDSTVNRIAFAANTGNPANGPAVGANGTLNYVANPLQDLDSNPATPAERDHNLFTIPVLGPNAGNPVVRLTQDPADDIEPAYEQGVYPPGAGVSPFNNWLAWSSKGRLQTGTLVRSTTYDIYFNDGTPETVLPPVRLFTPDTNAGALPLNQTDERYPTWSSSLPPQNPIDRIVFSSNRRNNVADPANALVGAPGDTDLWAAEVTDITPPTLFAIEEYAAELGTQFPGQDFSFLRGETLHISNRPLPAPGSRNGSPGEPFYFYTKLKDLQYGIESVWIQLKDPDGPSTDIRGVNHKLYGVGAFPLSAGSSFLANNVYVARYTSEPAITHLIHLPWETDYEGVGATDYQYFSDPVRFDDATIVAARYASKIAGVDDSVRWSGNQVSLFNPVPTSNRPPQDASGGQRWLRMHDDGIFPDLKPNDSIFSAEWVTPQDPSDFYVDLIAYDKAFNPRDPGQQENWIVYDNIWGFSTQAFISHNPVLFVDDNGAGQKWPRGLKGAFRTFPSFRFGTESDIGDRPQQFWPRAVPLTGGALLPIPGADVFGVIDAAGTVGSVPSPTFDFLTGDAVPYDYIAYSVLFNGESVGRRAYRYDMWRILAKGPVPEQVLNDYLPVRDEQPDPADPFNKSIQQLVPKRAVLWSSPYTGDIFLGGGSILDQATQQQLTTYRNRGGRLVVSGGDIAWALTVDGTLPNTFLANVLGATYRGDTSNIAGLFRNANYNPFTGGTLSLNISRDVYRSFNAIGSPPWWGPLRDPDPIGTSTDKPGYIKASLVNFRPDTFSGGNPVHQDNAGNGDFTASNDGTPFEVHDVIAPQAGWEMAFADRMVVNQSAVDGSKTVFMSFSLASLGRRNASDTDTSALSCMNYRSKISHAMFCWCFSADLTGIVRNLNGGAPIAGALVQVLVGGTVVGSAFSRTDGTYIVRGLPVTAGGWSVRVSTPGFSSFQKDTGSGAHGLDQASLDVLMSPAAPGSISGRVLDTSRPAGNPVPNVRIKATIQASPLYTGQRDFFATTGTDGRYTIPALPTASYVVSVDSLPPGFINPQPASQTVQVSPAQDTPNVDFTVVGQPGPLTVSVFAQLPDGTRGSAVAGAEVTLFDNVTGTPFVPGLQGMTNGSGQIVFDATLPVHDPNNGLVQANVPAGAAKVTAFKFGFQETSAVVLIPQQNAIEILLPTARTDLQIIGLVVRKSDQQPVAAADLPINVKVLRPSGLSTPLNADVFAPPNPGPPQHNYIINGAQGGDFLIAIRNHPRYKDTQVAVTVGSGVTVAPNLQVEGKDGKFFGVVRENNAGVAGPPIAGATVTIRNSVSGATVTTATTAADGTWDTGTTPLTSDVYDIVVGKFGFTSKVLSGVLLAGDTDVGTVLLDRAARGLAHGLVRRTLDGAALTGVKVDFVPVADPTSGGASAITVGTFTGPDGNPSNYSLGSTDTNQANLPAGDYDVKVTDSRFQTFTRRVTILGGQNNRVDIDLVARPGVLRGLVLDETDLTPISGATVTVTQGSAIRATAITGINGAYQTGVLQPGTYTVTAALSPQYQATSITVFVQGDTNAPDILLTRVPPSVVAGSVRSAVDNAFIGDVTIDLITTDGTNRIIATTTSTSTALASPPDANFRLDGVPPGSYTVRATKPGWVTVFRTITVNPSVNILNLRLVLDPDHIFGSGLKLISLPGDFPGQDAATILGKNPATFKSAYWLTTANTYAIYPNPPADEFRLGKGMFVRFNEPTAFAKVGLPAPNAPFALQVQAGWNLIGSVRRIRIEWLRVKVVTGAGDTFTMQEAMDRGIVQNGLFAYEDGYFRSDFMEPFRGYFMRAFQDVTLIIPVDNAVGSINSSAFSKVARHPAPSAAQVAAELAAVGMGPGSRNSKFNEKPARGAGSLFYRLPENPATSLLPSPYRPGDRRRKLG